MLDKADWEPDYDGTGVYATRHEPPQYVYRFEYESGGAVRSRCYPTREEAQAGLDETVARNEEFWADRVEPARTDPKKCVIDGHYYSVGDPSMRGARGFGGRQFHIARNDGTLIETTNLWYGGQIPAHWLERIPNNAEFVSGERWVELGGVRYLDRLS